jgi:hypothetical protein
MAVLDTVRKATADGDPDFLREGSYFPSLLKPRCRAGRALPAVAQEAYVSGVSTGRVDSLVRPPGIEGIGKREVSRICRASTPRSRRSAPGRSPTRPVLATGLVGTDAAGSAACRQSVEVDAFLLDNQGPSVHLGVDRSDVLA